MYSAALSTQAGTQAVNSMMAASPLTDYTVAVMGYMLLIGFLVTLLLGGGFLLINVGLLSKRNEDWTGKSNPSDLSVLKGSLWREEGHQPEILPAAEEEIPNHLNIVVPNDLEKFLLREDKMRKVA